MYESNLTSKVTFFVFLLYVIIEFQYVSVF